MEEAEERVGALYWGNLQFFPNNGSRDGRALMIAETQISWSLCKS